MVEVRQTEGFLSWLTLLRDRQARARILIRIRRLSLGQPGDIRGLGGGLTELRVDVGPGYRIDCARPQGGVVVLLLGGTKKSQRRDILRARSLLKEIGEPGWRE